MKKDIIEFLEGLEMLNEPKPIQMTDIVDAQEILGVKFAEDYIRVLQTYGEVELDGIVVNGLSSAFYTNVIIETLKQYKDDPTSPRGMYMIEDLGVDGVTSWQDSSGQIYCKYPFDEELQKDSNSLVEYIEKVLDDGDED